MIERKQSGQFYRTNNRSPGRLAITGHLIAIGLICIGASVCLTYITVGEAWALGTTYIAGCIAVGRLHGAGIATTNKMGAIGKRSGVCLVGATDDLGFLHIR